MLTQVSSSLLTFRISGRLNITDKTYLKHIMKLQHKVRKKKVKTCQRHLLILESSQNFNTRVLVKLFRIV